MTLNPLVDCSAHDPGMGIVCYTRPDWEIVRTATSRTPVPPTFACTKHLGEVIATTWPSESNAQTVAVVTKYEGA